MKQFTPPTVSEARYHERPGFGAGEPPEDLRYWIETLSAAVETDKPLSVLGPAECDSILWALAWCRYRVDLDARKIHKLESRVAEYETLSSHRGISHGGRIVADDDAPAG